MHRVRRGGGVWDIQCSSLPLPLYPRHISMSTANIRCWGICTRIYLLPCFLLSSLFFLFQFKEKVRKPFFFFLCSFGPVIQYLSLSFCFLALGLADLVKLPKGKAVKWKRLLPPSPHDDAVMQWHTLLSPVLARANPQHPGQRHEFKSRNAQDWRILRSPLVLCLHSHHSAHTSFRHRRLCPVS